MPKRDPKTLSGERHAKGWAVAQTYDIPSTLVDSTAVPGASSWRSGFAAGWAARDARDDEPVDDGTMVWLVDTRSARFVAFRSDAEARDDCRWFISGSDKAQTWREILEDVTDWGLLTEVKYQ